MTEGREMCRMATGLFWGEGVQRGKGMQKAHNVETTENVRQPLLKTSEHIAFWW